MGAILDALKNGTLFTGICSRLILGNSKTAHHLTNFSMQLKLSERLEKRYASTLEAFDKEYDAGTHECIRSNKVWVCWLQGMDNAPELVQKCYASLHQHLPERDIILVTAENMHRYAQLPGYILEKWKKGIISNDHLSDLLRLDLLIRHGGTWMDATVFCSGWSEKWNILLDSDLFFYQMLRPGRAGHTHFISSWFITACTDNKILMAVQAMLYKYWEKKDRIDDYFLFHDFFGMALRRYPDMWDRVLPVESSYSGMLQYRFFKTYDSERWNYMKSATPFHKLTYKVEPNKTQREGTYYRAFMEGKLERP